MKRSRRPIRRKTSLRPASPKRKTGINRRAAVKRVNATRKAREFVRTYHSKERVRFVKALGCVYCTALSPFLGLATAGTCHNAHTEGGGAGRKGPYTSIVPLDPTHHRRYDDRKPPFDVPDVRQAIKDCAPLVEAKWQAYLAAGAPPPQEASNG